MAPAQAAEDPAELIRLGAQLIGQGRFAEAAAPLKRAVALDPGGVDAHYILGVAQQGLGQNELAIASYARAIELYPAGHAEAHNNLGNALQALGRYAEALPHFDAALAAEPRYGLAMNNRGNALLALGRHRDALASYREALAVDPDDATAHYNIGLAQLALGEYAEGWSEYEWRYPHAGVQPRSQLPRAWNGEDLYGKSILLHAEQGLGDAIQFLRYAPLVAELGATVYLQIQAPLVPLVQKAPGVRGVCALGDAAPPTDYQCPLLSLPYLFGTTLETVPPPGAAAAVDPRVAAQRRAALGARAGEKLVGLSWRGSPQFVHDRIRSAGFAALAPLWGVPGIRFVSLQKELLEDERARAAGLPQLAHPGADFKSTAEMIAGLDLVISVDTAWAHWAGALGTPVWVLLTYSPHWAWLTGREDSPWYPSARLFRQDAARDWAPVIARVAAALRETAAA